MKRTLTELQTRIKHNLIKINIYIDQGLIYVEKEKISKWWDEITEAEIEISKIRNEKIKKLLK